MKNTALLIALTLSVLFTEAQTVIFSENFDGATINMSSSSSGTSGGWNLSSTFKTSGMFSDSAKVNLSDTLYLESNAFSTVGFTFLNLNFKQICKIDFFDRGKLEYSTDNGVTWVGITSTSYTGNGNMFNNSFSAISYSTWNVSNSAAIPNQTWWQTESFNISAAGNNTQVKVRFLLIDADNNGAVGNYGWLLDDVEVIGSACELIPPSITLTGTTYQGAVFGTGPYQIQADIQDASGVSSATLDYTINGGAVNSVAMTNSSGSIYQATIPSATVNDTLCYTIRATDNSSCSNSGSLPSFGCTQFIVNPNAPPNCVGNPISNFNYAETFASFTPGTGNTNGGVGTLNNNWANSTADTHDWWVYNSSTNSTLTGPSADHSPNDANYMYVEASGSFSNTTAILNTPCYNLSGLLAPKFSFWYHMYGNQMGELRVDLYDGNGWISNVTPAIIGDQGNNWFFREIDLSSYAGNIVQLRFRAIVGIGFRSDIAIDDIEIIEPIPTELSLTSVVAPSGNSCNGSATEQVTVSIENLGSLPQDTIPMAYRINGTTTYRDTSFFNLVPGATFNHTFQPTFNMSAAGTYTIDAWVELAADGKKSNDSLFGQTAVKNIIATNFPDTIDFENYRVGNLSGNWANDLSNTYDWAVLQGGTPSAMTGPIGDTTTPSGLGNYIYYEATAVPTGEEGSVVSNCINTMNLNRPELKFYYHMNGIEMGELHVDLNLNGFLIRDIVPAIIGNQGNRWIQRTVDLTPFKGIVKLVFRAKRGSGYRSDIAIDQITLRDALPVSISEIATETNFNLFPNPFKDKLNVSLESDATVRIYNLTGSLVFTKRLNSGFQSLQMSGLSKGVYFLNIENDGSLITRKIIKN